MSLRETMNQNPRLAVGVGVVGVVLAVALIAWQAMGGPKSGQPEPLGKTFYTEDEGKTYFADSIDKLAVEFKGPQGKPAVRAYVYQFPGEQPVVGWMESYTPKGREILKAFYQNPQNRKSAPPESPELRRETLVKRPGMKAWVNVGALPGAANQVTMFPTKNGETPTMLAPPEQ